MAAAVYSSLKPLHFAGHLAALGRGEAPPPVHVRLKPTNVCNHACYFCAYRSDGLSLGEDMNLRDRIPRDKMCEIVTDLIDMGVKAVTFSGGGEPLIYPYIVETVAALGSAGIAIGCLSNGSQLKGKAAEAMAAHGTWLRVSIDGWDDASYARYRGVPEGAFTKVMANIAAFADRGSTCTLGASIIVDRDNAAHIAELSRQLKDAGVAHVKISPCIVGNDGADNNRYHADIEATVRTQIEQASELADDRFAIVDHYHRLPEMFDKSYGTCPMAHLLTVIGADCKVYTCQDKAYTESGCLGSIADRRFRDFWADDETREQLRTLDPRIACRHHCVAEGKNRLLRDYLDLDAGHVAFV